jgi:hypothetical protein
VSKAAPNFTRLDTRVISYGPAMPIQTSYQDFGSLALNPVKILSRPGNGAIPAKLMILFQK